ncbi:MAG: S8 family serine peptidase, partial [Longimicrobiales bacterium]
MLKRRLVATLGALALASGLAGRHAGVADVTAVTGVSGVLGKVRPVWLFYDPTTTDAAHVVADIERAGGSVRVRSRWLHAVSAQLDARRARQIPGVIHVQPVGYVYASVSDTPVTPDAPDSPVPPAVQQDSTAYGPNFSALRQLGVPQMHALGFNGSGIRIAILDTGFDPAHEAFAGARVIATRDFIHGDSIVTTQPGDRPSARDQELHGTWVWSILGGNRQGQIIGPAFNAQFILAKVDIEQVGEDEKADEDRWVLAFEWADDQGAQVICSALAYKRFLDKNDYTPADMNGRIAVSSSVAHEAARRGILLVNAIGNTDPTGPAPAGSLFAPADADSIIAVGAIDSLGQIWFRSARGPTADNRTKPELVARGVNVRAANAITNSYETVAAGTSLAAPFVAGIAGMFMQAWPSLNPLAVRQALISSGSNADFEDNTRGFGVPNVAAAILFPQGVRVAGVDEVDLPTNTLTTIRPVFRWQAPLVHPSMQPRYRLELAADAQFNTIIYSDTVTGSFSLPLRQPLKPRVAIWWRVVAQVDVPAPGIRRSTNVPPPISMPSWVRLLVLNSPQPQFVNTTRPVFSWQPLTAPPPLGPFVYDLQILNANNLPVQTLRNLMVSNVTLTDPLTPNLPYSWRVIA